MKISRVIFIGLLTFGFVQCKKSKQFNIKRVGDRDLPSYYPFTQNDLRISTTKQTPCNLAYRLNGNNLLTSIYIYSGSYQGFEGKYALINDTLYLGYSNVKRQNQWNDSDLRTETLRSFQLSYNIPEISIDSIKQVCITDDQTKLVHILGKNSWW